MTRDEISRLLETSGLMRRLAAFDPHWIGSSYLDVHDEGSDIDICCSFEPSLGATRTAIESACEAFGPFILTDELYRGQPSRIVRFQITGKPIEVYGRAHPVHDHEFFRFTQTEARLLALHGPALKAAVIGYRREGMDTETAFVRALGLDVDPHSFLLDLYDQDDDVLKDLRPPGGSA